MLIVDATTGQNAISQVKEFKKITNVTGLVLTKLDGTAKGGIVLAIKNELKVPIKYVGTGEKIDDISEFDAIVEVSEANAGFMPELSYGSHVFQDLVEAGILYSAVFEDDSTRSFDPAAIRSMKNSLTKYIKPAKKLKDVVYVYEASPDELVLYYDMSSERLVMATPKKR